VKGVGPITSLAYVLTLEDPQRFSSSREVGPYLGLVPKQEDSGDSQPQLGISKAGDRMLRRLLVGSSQYMLGSFGPDTDLRRYGLRLCERGGKNAKKRAVVAVARKTGRVAPSLVGDRGCLRTATSHGGRNQDSTSDGCISRTQQCSTIVNRRNREKTGIQ
jgi:transposase